MTETIHLESVVKCDKVTERIAESFDYDFTGTVECDVPRVRMDEIEADFSLGLIVGPSGSGKTTNLAEFGEQEIVRWSPEKSVASHFDSFNDASERLSAAGFNSIHDWLKPYHVLSTGQAFRADIARRLKCHAVIDEFTSVVDRNVAKSCSCAVSRYVKGKGLKGVVLATCHYDIIDWLEPDWVFDTAEGEFTHRGLLRRPTISVSIRPCGVDRWRRFRDHHYLTGNINKGAKCWVAEWEGKEIAFASAIAYPSGTVKNAWRGHRLVVLPEFQGLGVGARLSEAIGEMFVLNGCRYFSKTAHPKLGEYRDASDRWRPTSKNHSKRGDYKSGRKTKESGHKMKHADRLCYSHEFIGGSNG